MTNQEVARLLFQLADALDIAGGRDQGFRVRALRAGAQVVSGLGQPVSELLADGRLLEVRGIGRGIAQRIEEILSTGALAELDALQVDVPTAQLEFLHAVEGIGPKTAKLVNEKLGITTLDELEAACKAGKLRDLPRLGARREAQILAAIARSRANRGRVKLARAEQEAKPILQRLEALPFVERIALAGSARRKRDTVADLDLLVASREPAQVMEAFATMAMVGLILARGDTKTSVKLAGGLQVDLRVVSPEEWGAALVYFTGSKDHNIRLRARGVRRGLKINEYGVFSVADGSRLGGSTEEEVYRAVELPWIPPELREDRGEIEAAARGTLPDLVVVGDLRGDLHMHTDATDGKASLETMIETALSLGREYIAITDHSQNLAMVGGLDAARVAAQGRQIQAWNARLAGRMRVLAGIEADILADGTVDLGPEVLLGLDWVIGSVHSHFHLPRAEQTRRIVRAMESGLIDVVGHPTGRLIGSRQPYEVDLDEVIATAARTGVALELNSFPDRLDLDDQACRRAKAVGAWVVIDSDSHAPTHLVGLRHGVEVARRGWLEARHILNAQPLEFLLAHRNRRKYETFAHV